MTDTNLFTMLSAYRPNSPATPFENYCTSALAYFLRQGHRMLTALFADAAGAAGEPIAMVEVQPPLADAGVADLLLTFEGGTRAVVEVQVEAGADESHLAALQSASDTWGVPVVPVMLLIEEAAPSGWRPVRWLDVVEALDGDPDPLAVQFSQFVLNDVLGLGTVSLDQAVTTNRLYALGGAAVRRRFGYRVRYVNSASRPVSGRYRYVGTTFALDGGEMQYWVGLVNEALPLSQHYHLMLASKELPVRSPAEHPRATGDWKWKHWTGIGRVVRPIAADDYEALLERIGS